MQVSSAKYAMLALAFGISTHASAAEDIVAKAKETIAKYSHIPTFVAPGPAFDAKKCMSAKTMTVIPFHSAVPFAQDILGGMKDSAKKVGFRLDEWENQGQPTQWAAGITNAINTKASLIDLMGGVDPATVEPQIEQAKHSGIAVTTGHFYDYSQKPNPALTSNVPNNFAEIGRILASWAIAKTDGAAHVLVIGSDEIVPTAPLVAALRERIAECPKCSMIYQNVPVPDWSTKIQSVVQSTLLANPSINYILPIYDSMTQFVEPALTLTGKAGSVKVASFNGTPFVIDMVRDGSVEMVIGESPDWVGRILADHDMRVLCDAKIDGNPTFPFMIWTAENAASAGTPASSAKGYGTNYISEFAKLWGVE